MARIVGQGAGQACGQTPRTTQGNKQPPRAVPRNGTELSFCLADADRHSGLKRCKPPGFIPA